MGINAVILAKGEISFEELTNAVKFMQKHLPEVIYGYEQDPFYIDEYGIHLCTMMRFYAPEYPRGYWETLSETILTMRVLFPNCTIHYGAETDNPSKIPEITDKKIEQLWEYWTYGNAFHNHTKEYLKKKWRKRI